MFRHAYRAVLGVVVALGLGLGAAAVITSTSTNAAASAVDCSVQQSTYDAAVAHQRAVKHKLVKAQRQLKRAKRALRRAVAAGDVAKAHKLAKKVRKLKRLVKRLKHRYSVARDQTAAAHTALATCLASTPPPTSPTTPTTTKPTTPTTTAPTPVPIQTLCDAGIPQAVCDALAGLAGGGLPSDISLDALCDAAPQLQPLCDAANGPGGLPTDPAALTDLLAPLLDLVGLGDLLGGGLPSDLTSVQALCDAGVPQSVCDGLTALAGGGLPSDLSLQQLCDAVPETQPLCDATNGPGGLPTDPSALTDLLTPILETLGLDQLLCDLLGGLLCIGLP